jgi:predicted DNA-binding transcriptional regulator AlpA
MRRRHTTRAAAPAPAEPPLLLTPQQAFALVQVGRTHGWRLINSGAIPSVKLSPRCIRVPRQALEALIAAGGVQGTTAVQPEPVPLKLHA